MSSRSALPIELQAGGLRWRLRRAGLAPASGPGLLLLHGTGSSLQSWSACLPGLAQHFSAAGKMPVRAAMPGQRFRCAADAFFTVWVFVCHSAHDKS